MLLWWNIIKLKFGNAVARGRAAEFLGEHGGIQGVKPLIVALHDGNSDLQQKVAGALVKIGVAAVDSLTGTLWDSDRDVRCAAADALGKIGDARAVMPLITILKNRDDYLRSAAAEALARIGFVSVEPLIQALKDSNSSVRCAAADALGKIGDARAVEPLIAVLNDEGRNVRQRAACALAEIGVTALEPLIEALKHGAGCGSSDYVVYALANIGVAAVAPLITALKDSGSVVRWTAAKALGRIRDAQAVEPLISALNDGDRGVRSAVAEALDEFGWRPAYAKQRVLYAIAQKRWDDAVKEGDVAVEPLIASLYDSEREVRLAAAKSLGKIDDARAATPLIAALLDIHSDVRRVAAEALDRLGWQPANAAQRAYYAIAQERWEDASKEGAAVVELIIEALHHSDERVRKGAAGVLGEIRDKRAIDPLIERLGDNGRGVRQSVGAALKRLKWQPANIEQRVLYSIALGCWQDALKEGPAAIDIIEESLMIYHDSLSVRAAETLAELGNAKGLNILLGELGGRDTTPSSVINAIVKVGDERALWRLKEELDKGKTNWPQLQKAMVAILRRCVSKMTVESLQKVAAMKNAHYEEFFMRGSGYGNSGFACQDSKTMPIDCSELRQLAKQELLQRQSVTKKDQSKPF